MFAYCLNNPVNYCDPEGKVPEWVVELLETIKESLEQAEGVFALAGVITQVDSPFPGPADLAGGGIAALALLYCLGEAVYTTLTAPAQSIPRVRTNTDEKLKEQVTIDVAPTRQYNYWSAELANHEVIVGEPLTFIQASMRVAQRKSIMCRNQNAARAILLVNGYWNAVGPEKGKGEGFYWHYHPTRNHTGYQSTHIWFYTLEDLS